MIQLRNEVLRLLKEANNKKVIVYHGSSDKDLKVRDNSVIWFTSDKGHARYWADRLILGDKEEGKPSYIYTAEITIDNPYIIGDENANPMYKEIENLTGTDKEDALIEIFYDDVTNSTKVRDFVRKGYDCFIDNYIWKNSNVVNYAIPSEYKNHIKWLNFEEMKD